MDRPLRGYEGTANLQARMLQTNYADANKYAPITGSIDFHLQL
jgi:hypothetical protein